MLVNTITSPTLQDSSPTDSHNASFYPMLRVNASPPSLTPSLLPSHTSVTSPTDPSLSLPLNLLSLTPPFPNLPAVLHSRLRSPTTPIHCQRQRAFMFPRSSMSSNPHAHALPSTQTSHPLPLHYLRLSPPLPPQTGALVGILDPAHGTHQTTKTHVRPSG